MNKKIKAIYQEKLTLKAIKNTINNKKKSINAELKALKTSTMNTFSIRTIAVDVQSFDATINKNKESYASKDKNINRKKDNEKAGITSLAKSFSNLAKKLKAIKGKAN